MKKFSAALCTALLALSIKSISAEEPAAKEIVDKSYEASKVSGTEAVSVMTIIDSKGRKRVRKIAQATKLYDNGDTEKKIIRFLSPADVEGTGLLTFDYENKDDDMWLYMPALRKTRRIISSEKAKSFMGSEFSYADVAPPVLDDFTYKKLGEEKINDILCWKIEILPKNDDVADENGFSKKISFVGKNNFIARKAIYYDLDGELHKELNINKIKEVDPKNHKYRPVDLIMVNKQNGRVSTLLIEKIDVVSDIKDEFFSIRYLEKQ